MGAEIPHESSLDVVVAEGELLLDGLELIITRLREWERRVDTILYGSDGSENNLDGSEIHQELFSLWVQLPAPNEIKDLIYG